MAEIVPLSARPNPNKTPCPCPVHRPRPRPSAALRTQKPNRRPVTREQAYDWLAARFTDWGWRPDEMRAAEAMSLPSTPVADRMAAVR